MSITFFASFLAIFFTFLYRVEPLTLDITNSRGETTDPISEELPIRFPISEELPIRCEEVQQLRADLDRLTAIVETNKRVAKEAHYLSYCGIGIYNDRVPDSAFTASSFLTNDTAPYHARLNSESFWEPKGDIFHYNLTDTTFTYSISKQFCRSEGLNLCSAEEICPNGTPVITGVLYGDQWTPIRDNRNDWVHISDDFGRNGRICWKHVQHYGPPPWGVTPGPCPPWNRIKTCDLKGNLFCCPPPGTGFVNAWLEVDLGEPTRTFGVMTQGRQNTNKYVICFKIAYSNSTDDLIVIQDQQSNNDMIFTGNEDGNTPKTNMFPMAITARYFRFIIITYHDVPALRIEYLTC